MKTYALKIASNGRLLIPADMRAAVGIGTDTTLAGRVVDGRIVLEPIEASIRRAQDIVRRHVRPGEPSPVDELIAERRAAAAAGD